MASEKTATSNLAAKIIAVAETQLGVQEVPKNSNSGPDVEKYLASVKLGKGYSWCMAFVYWCVNKACIEAAIPNPLIATGGVLAQWNKIDKKYKVTMPQPGDIFILDFGGGKGHTGFVTSVANGRVQTIEGNSNDEGSREGYEVCRKPGGRKITSIKGFIRIT